MTAVIFTSFVKVYTSMQDESAKPIKKKKKGFSKWQPCNFQTSGINCWHVYPSFSLVRWIIMLTLIYSPQSCWMFLTQSATYHNLVSLFILTSMRVHSVDWVVLWIQCVLKMELGELQHSLYDVLYVDSLGHARRGHDVKSCQAGVCWLCDSLHYQVSPEFLLIFSIVVLRLEGEIMANVLLQK